MRIEQPIVRGAIDGSQSFAEASAQRVRIQTKGAARATRELQQNQVERHFR